jgi:hypothetical protein
MKPKMEKESVMDIFTELVQDEKWMSIDDIFNKVQGNPELVERLLSGGAREKALKSACRQMVKRMKDENGMPRFASIITKDADGNETRVYKQETLFDVNDFVQLVDYHGKQVVHHAKMASHYSDKHKEATGKQVPLPFNEKSILLD